MTRLGVEVGDVMTRLVAVDVLSDEPGAVLLPSLSLGFGRQFEEVVELGDELLVAALSVEGEAIERGMRRSRGLDGDTPFQPDSIEAGRGVSVPARPDERIDPVNGCGENVIQNTRSRHQQKPTFHP